MDDIFAPSELLNHTPVCALVSVIFETLYVSKDIIEFPLVVK